MVPCNPVQTLQSVLGYDLQKRGSAETLLHWQGPVKMKLLHVQLT